MADRKRPTEEDAQYAVFLQSKLLEIARQGNIAPGDLTDLYQTTTDPEILAANIKAMKAQLESPIINAALSYNRNASR